MQISEDLVQITFEKIIRYCKKFKSRSSVKHWIFTIARNAFIDNYHRAKKHTTTELMGYESSLFDSENQESRMIKKEQEELLKRAMSILSPEKRELLAMVKLNEMKYKDVAEMYGMTVSNLKVKIFRIMKELKQHSALIKQEY